MAIFGKNPLTLPPMPKPNAPPPAAATAAKAPAKPTTPAPVKRPTSSSMHGGRKAYTLTQLLQFQHRYNISRVKNARLCGIQSITPVRTKKGNPGYVFFVSDNIQGSGRLHRVDITSRNLSSPEKTNQPFVSCDCEDFTYRCEYALATVWNMTVIRYSNGEPAEEKNPQNYPYFCKHVIIAIAHMLQLT